MPQILLCLPQTLPNPTLPQILLNNSQFVSNPTQSVFNPSQLFSVALIPTLSASSPTQWSWLMIRLTFVIFIHFIYNFYSVCEVYHYNRLNHKCCIEDMTYTTLADTKDHIVYRPVTTVSAKRAPTVSTFV